MEFETIKRKFHAIEILGYKKNPSTLTSLNNSRKDPSFRVLTFKESLYGKSIVGFFHALQVHISKLTFFLQVLKWLESNV